MDFNTCDLQSLAQLLNPDPREDSSDEEGPSHTSKSKLLGPGSIGTPFKPVEEPKISAAGDGKGAEPTSSAHKKCIWSEEEVKLTSSIVPEDVLNDPRITPSYDSYFRQAVSSEDIYLQMGNKTPGTASCENFVVVIQLPGETYAKMQLEVKPDKLVLRSPKYFLHLPLPCPVNPNGGNAKWDSDTEKLTVTLQLSRELDFVNF